MIIYDKRNIGYLLLFVGNYGFAQNCAPTFGGSTFGSSQFGSGNFNCIASLLPPGIPSITEVRNNGNSITIYFAPGTGGNPSSFTVICLSTDNSNNLTSSSSTSPITVSPLTIGLSYRCSVSATNSAGTSAQSTTSDLILATPIGIPTMSEITLIFMAFSLVMIASRKVKNIYR
jgi:hypothetical protein